MTRIPFSLATLAAPALPAAAQELYYGGGLAYTSGECQSEAAPDDSYAALDAGMATILLGQRFAAGSGFLGWEVSADLAFGAETEQFNAGSSTDTCAEASALFAHLCEHKATLRLVGTYSLPVGNGTTLQGALGLGMLQGEFADDFDTTESASVYGATVGIGLIHDMGTGMSARGEVIYDNFTKDTQYGSFSSNYQGTTFRLTLLRNF